MSYSYINSDPGLWTVGTYDPDGIWMPVSDHKSEEDAAARVSYLNGNPVDRIVQVGGELHRQGYPETILEVAIRLYVSYCTHSSDSDYRVLADSAIEGAEAFVREAEERELLS